MFKLFWRILISLDFQKWIFSRWTSVAPFMRAKNNVFKMIHLLICFACHVKCFFLLSQITWTIEINFLQSWRNFWRKKRKIFQSIKPKDMLLCKQNEFTYYMIGMEIWRFWCFLEGNDLSGSCLRNWTGHFGSH